MRPTVKIVVSKDLDRRMKKLAQITRQQFIHEALTEGAEVIAEEARRLVPERTGNLRESIGVGDSALNYSRGKVGRGQEEVFVGPRQGRNEPHDGFYGHMVEFGTINAGPRPFIRPAFDTQSDAAIRVVIDRLAAEFDRLAAA